MKNVAKRNAHHLHVVVKASCWLLLNLGISLNIVCITRDHWKTVECACKEQFIWLYCGYADIAVWTPEHCTALWHTALPSSERWEDAQSPLRPLQSAPCPLRSRSLVCCPKTFILLWISGSAAVHWPSRPVDLLCRCRDSVSTEKPVPGSGLL